MATATCRHDGCPKNGEAVPDVPTTWVDDEGNEQPIGAVICGACGTEITDIA
jgi:hypothetical protein